MTSAHLSKYEVGRDETAELISEGYGLSWEAIRDIPANEHLRPQLPRSGKVATGLLLNIPPHAGRLVRDRLNVLHRIRPRFLSHFHRITECAESELRPVLEGASEPLKDVKVQEAMRELQSSAAADINALATSTAPLVGICSGMAHTHVASEYDKKAAASATDPLCGLYWLVSPEKFEFWRSFWMLQTWSARWDGSDGPHAWQVLQRQNHTAGSIVIKSIDEKIRQGQKMEGQLLVEFRRSSSG